MLSSLSKPLLLVGNKKSSFTNTKKKRLDNIIVNVEIKPEADIEKVVSPLITKVISSKESKPLEINSDLSLNLHVIDVDETIHEEEKANSTMSQVIASQRNVSEINSDSEEIVDEKLHEESLNARVIESIQEIIISPYQFDTNKITLPLVISTNMVVLSMLGAWSFNDNEQDLRQWSILLGILMGILGALPFMCLRSREEVPYSPASSLLELWMTSGATMTLLSEAIPLWFPSAGTAAVTVTSFMAGEALNRYCLWKSRRAESFGISMAPAFFITVNNEKVQPELDERGSDISDNRRLSYEHI